MDKEVLGQIYTDVKEIKTQVLELVKQGAIHNTILHEHEKRSTQLETRLDPVERDFYFRGRFFAVALGSGGCLGLCLAVIQLFKLFR